MPEEQTVEAPPSVLVEFARQYAEMEAKVEALELQAKEAKKQLGAIERKLVDEMTTQQIRAFRAEGLGGFRAQGVVYPNVVDKETLLAFLKKKKLGFLFSTSVHGGKLRAWVKELMEQNKKIPPGIEPFATTEIRRFK